tara:strand:- start:65 stop:796 length:732 start_codon:yes stop_codon:yes gene_type:complete
MEFFQEIIILVILIIFQSTFGVGLLLFGTPTFLYFDYSFSETLYLLLPISFIISLIQFVKSEEKQKSFIYNFNIFTLPSLTLSLVIILYFQELLNLKIFISIMLIVLSIASIDKNRFNKILSKNINKNIFLIFLGLIHGFTNLGGGFLALYSNIVVKKNKNLTRYYISYGYLIMVFVQLIILFTLYREDFNFVKLLYIFLAVIIYFPSQLIYNRIDQNKFSTIIRLIAIFYGFFVLISSLNFN